MSMDPERFKPFHIRGIKYGSSSDFRGFGSDSSHYTDNIIYFTHLGLGRIVSFKAFLESFKLNLTKKVDFFREIDKPGVPAIEYYANVSYSLAINIPAHSTNESRNNLAKLEEIQRLISPIEPNKISKYFGTGISLFSVWFKNLIGSGAEYSGYPKPDTITKTQALQNGFLCYIDKVNFEPDIEAGFFDYDDVTDGNNGKFLYPKNIKLKLDIKYAGQPNASFTAKLLQADITVPTDPVCGFEKSGDYIIADNGGWPFGLGIFTNNMSEKISRKKDYTTDEINSIESDYASITKNSYLFISAPIRKDTDGTRKRWVLFNLFLDSFNRNYEINYPTVEGDKSLTFGQPLNMDAESTFRSLDYSIKIQVPSKNLTEAKKNAAKIQYLVRMFVKKKESLENIKPRTDSELLQEGPEQPDAPSSSPSLASPGAATGEQDVSFYRKYDSANQYFDSQYTFNFQKSIGDLDTKTPSTANTAQTATDFVKRVTSETPLREENDSIYLRVYMPSFIEKAGASTWQPKYNNFEGMYDNAVPLICDNFSFDIDIEQGFFEESGKLYPKAYSIDLKFHMDKPGAITNYGYTKAGIEMLPGHYAGKEHLFPFNRQTSKIKLG